MRQGTWRWGMNECATQSGGSLGWTRTAAMCFRKRSCTHKDDRKERRTLRATARPTHRHPA
jgi:hypothetical protein